LLSYSIILHSQAQDGDRPTGSSSKAVYFLIGRHAPATRFQSGVGISAASSLQTFAKFYK
jgi:hypothetical protein